MTHALCRRPPALRPLLAAIGCAAVLVACGGMPPASDQLAVADAAVERATGPAAAEAPVELAAARDKLTRAHAAQAAGEPVLARQLAEQAEADATLAEAQARSIRAARALAEVRLGIAQLRQEIPRETAPPARAAPMPAPASSQNSPLGVRP